MRYLLLTSKWFLVVLSCLDGSQSFQLVASPASLEGKSFVLTQLTGGSNSVPTQTIFTADTFSYGFSGNLCGSFSYSYSNGTVTYDTEEVIKLTYTSETGGTYEKGYDEGNGFNVEYTGTFEEANISLSLQTNWQRTETMESELSSNYWRIQTTSGESVVYNDGELNFTFDATNIDSTNGYPEEQEIDMQYAGALPLDEDWQIVIDDTYVSYSVNRFSMSYELSLEGSLDCEFGFVDEGAGREVSFYAESGSEYAEYYTYQSSADDPRIQKNLNFRVEHLASTRELVYSYQPDGVSEWSELARINLSTGVVTGLSGSGTLTGQLPSSSENLFFTVDIKANEYLYDEAIPIENIEIGGIEIGSDAPPVGQTDSDGDGIIDTEDPFPNEPLELEKLGPNDFQPKENVGWIEVTYAYTGGQTFMPGIWHPIEDNLGAWFPFDDSWPPYTDGWPFAWPYVWNSEQQTSTNSVGDGGEWSHYKTSNPYVYTCKFNWASGTYGFGFTYDGRIDLDNDGIQDGIQIRSRLKFPAQGSQIDFHEILNALSDNLSLFALPINFTENDYDGDGRENNIDIDDDNDGIADAYDAIPLLFNTSHKVPSSLSGYVEIYFSDIYPSYGIWHGTGENTAINIWNDTGSEVRFDDNYSWDSQHLTSTGSQYGGIFRVNFKDKTNDVFFRFTYVTEFDGESADDRGKGFFYDGRIDLDNNGVEDGQQIRSGAPFPSDSSSIDLAAIYNSAESNFIPANVLDFASNEKYFPNEYQELRAGSTMIEVSNNQASIQLQMEQSTDLKIWNAAGAPAMMTIPADADTKFFRFKMAD